ncbi:insulinase family protein [Geovibrio thiophilus]|uniref:Insulinase family protein n=1 Tax=Geovibrio thiophilus TaxID=139438 RepID=A0A410K014_9BACT|nr:pitrilysin family protein [Geovibrio thiophilus]QAR33744.1 insulinase family protein [Geovibrio thiophilus]
MKKVLLLLIIYVISGVRVLAAVDTLSFENGVKMVYRSIPSTGIVSVHVWMKTGSVNENPENNGISHFLEHMVFKGTASYAPGAIDEVVESAGGSMNAATSKDYTFYHITLPVYNAETAFKVLSEMLFDAKFIPEEIEKEKPIVVQEIKRKFDKPTYDMWTYLYEALFRSSPYEMEVIGSEETVNSFSRDTLVDYYGRYYHPQNMTLVVAGDIDRSTAESLGRKYFSKMKDGRGKRYEGNALKTYTENYRKDFYRQVVQETGVIAFPAAALNEKDIFAYEVLGEILSGGEYSVLSTIIKNELRLASSVNAGYLGMKHGGSFIFTYTCPVGNSGKVKDAILKVAASIDKFVDQKSLEKCENRLKSQIAFQRERASSEARDIGYSYTLDIPGYYHNFLNKMSGMKTEEITSLAADIFSRPYIDLRTLPEESGKKED